MPLRPKANGRGAALGGGNAAIAVDKPMTIKVGNRPKPVTKSFYLCQSLEVITAQDKA